MSATKTRWCWRKDLAEFRGLTSQERSGFLLVLEWFENFRLRQQLEAGEEAARDFWRTEVLREGRPRERWQLEHWEDAASEQVSGVGCQGGCERAVREPAATP